MTTFEQIANANKTLNTVTIEKTDKKTGRIVGKEYAEVNQRIKAFRMVHPNGCITTEIISIENGVVIMKTTVMDDEGRVIGSGMAQEKEQSSFINKTSYIENCETSAVGRALGMCGFGIDTSVASYEEVATAMKNQEQPAAKPEMSNRDQLTKYISETAVDEDDFKLKMGQIAKEYKLNGKSTEADFKNVLDFLKDGK